MKPSEPIQQLADEKLNYVVGGKICDEFSGTVTGVYFSNTTSNKPEKIHKVSPNACNGIITSAIKSEDKKLVLITVEL